MDVLRIGTFSRSVLLQLAERSGRLDEAGLVITEIPVASSPDQFNWLADGQLDGAITNPDNAIAYRFLPSNPLGRIIDVRITAALDRGLGLTLGLRPGLNDLDELRGGVVAVDVPTSGYAFLAFDLLAKRGIEHSAYRVITQGATPFRAKSLARGETDVTILNAGNELRAAQRGCTLEGSLADVGPYIGAVLVRLHDADQAEALDRLALALVRTADEIRQGAWYDEVVSAARELLGLSEDDAEAHARTLRDPRDGLVGGGVFDRDSLETLIRLRSQYLPAPELSTIGSRLDELLQGIAAGRSVVESPGPA